MDELAIKLKMDPVELRLKNDTLTDESNGKPFSSRHLKECLQVGSEKFGWSKRTPEVGSMRRGDTVLGWGVAAASWGAYRGGCQATVMLKADGRATVMCAAQDPGMGTYTILAQIVSDKTGLPVDKIDVQLGDSDFVPGSTSGGSTLTATIMPAVADATNGAVQIVLAMATRPGAAFDGQEAGRTGDEWRECASEGQSGERCSVCRCVAHGEGELCERRWAIRWAGIGHEGEGLFDAFVRRAVCGGGVAAEDCATAREPRGVGDRWRAGSST